MRSVNFMKKIKEFFLTHTAARLGLYALILAAVMLVWLHTKGEGVAFLYSEF